MDIIETENVTNRSWRSGPERSTTTLEITLQQPGQVPALCFCHLPWRPLQTALQCTCSWWAPCQWLSPGSTPRCRREEKENCRITTQRQDIILSYLKPGVSASLKYPISNVSAPDICRLKTMKCADLLCQLAKLTATESLLWERSIWSPSFGFASVMWPFLPFFSLIEVGNRNANI